MISTPNSAPSPSSTGILSSRNYTFLQQYIHSRSGIVIEADKHYLLESRLLPIIKEHKIASLDVLCTMLATSAPASLSRRVIEAMTTNETFFYRDTAVFEALSRSVLPSIFNNLTQRRKIRIWSAAASSGQEAYSIAMILLEMGKGREDFEIIGTDLSEQVLARAREGRYVKFEVSRGLAGVTLSKYFTENGTEWQLRDHVRSLVKFQQLDLRQDFRSLGSFDLILCRNVLIYFDVPTKTKIVQGIRDLLSPGALLVLGGAETVLNISSAFRRLTVDGASFYTAASEDQTGTLTNVRPAEKKIIGAQKSFQTK